MRMMIVTIVILTMTVAMTVLPMVMTMMVVTMMMVTMMIVTMMIVTTMMMCYLQFIVMTGYDGGESGCSSTVCGRATCSISSPLLFFLPSLPLPLQSSTNCTGF